MDEEPTLIQVILNENHSTHALVDNGCQCYAAISEELWEEQQEGT